MLVCSAILLYFCPLPNHLSRKRHTNARTNENIGAEIALGKIVGKGRLNVDFLIIDIKLTIEILVYVELAREVQHVIVQLQIAHGIVTFKAD